MAKRLTDYAANAVGDWMRGTTPPPVSNLSLRIFSVAPTVSGGGTQYPGSSDQPVTLAAFASSASSNTALLTFSGLSAGTIAAVALVDGVSGDVLWFDDGLSVAVTAGETKVVQVGDLDVAFIA